MDILEKIDMFLGEERDRNVKGDGPEYKKFFDKMLKKFGVKSPSELSTKDKVKFWNSIDAGWKGDNEKD